MKYFIFYICLFMLLSCSDNTEQKDVPATDSTAQSDSLKKVQEEEEVSEELIHGAFDALNR